MKPIENARYEAYQMRMQGRNYNASVAENKNHALESMLRPEVLTSTFFNKILDGLTYKIVTIDFYYFIISEYY